MSSPGNKKDRLLNEIISSKKKRGGRRTKVLSLSTFIELGLTEPIALEVCKTQLLVSRVTRLCPLCDCIGSKACRISAVSIYGYQTSEVPPVELLPSEFTEWFPFLTKS